MSLPYEVCHLLMTRFNLPTPGREARHRNRRGWLAARFELFERYCLPSVAAQVTQDFSWIIYLDEETPAWARARIAAARRVREFHPAYTGLFDSTGWAWTAREVVGPPRAGRAIITSNLDNDDGIAQDYCARVRRAAVTRLVPPRFAVNVPEGIVLTGSSAYRHVHLQNAFTNLVELDDDSFGTTMMFRHMELSDHVPVIQAEGSRPGWLQVVHEGNVSNRVRGRRIDPADVRDAFAPGALDGALSPTAPESVADALLAPFRTLRDRGVAFVRRMVSS